MPACLGVHVATYGAANIDRQAHQAPVSKRGHHGVADGASHEPALDAQADARAHAQAAHREAHVRNGEPDAAAYQAPVSKRDHHGVANGASHNSDHEPDADVRVCVHGKPDSVADAIAHDVAHEARSHALALDAVEGLSTWFRASSTRPYLTTKPL